MHILAARNIVVIRYLPMRLTPSRRTVYSKNCSIRYPSALDPPNTVTASPNMVGCAELSDRFRCTAWPIHGAPAPDLLLPPDPCQVLSRNMESFDGLSAEWALDSLPCKRSPVSLKSVVAQLWRRGALVLIASCDLMGSAALQGLHSNSTESTTSARFFNGGTSASSLARLVHTGVLTNGTRFGEGTSASKCMLSVGPAEFAPKPVPGSVSRER